jgi:hypothetical protein
MPINPLINAAFARHDDFDLGTLAVLLVSILPGLVAPPFRN